MRDVCFTPLGKDILHKKCGVEPGFIFIELSLDLYERMCKTKTNGKNKVSFYTGASHHIQNLKHITLYYYCLVVSIIWKTGCSDVA